MTTMISGARPAVALRGWRRALLATTLALGACGAHAQVAISLSPGPVLDVNWGTVLTLRATLSGACTGSINGATVSLTDFDLRTVTTANVAGSSCVGGALTNAVVTFDDIATHTLEIGTHIVRARMGATAASNLVTIRVQQSFTNPWSAGAVLTGISTTPLFSQCERRLSGQFERELAPVPPPPPNLRTPYEITSFISGGCVFGTASPSPPHRQWASMQMPAIIPPEAQVWVYDNFFGPLQWRQAERVCEPVACPPPPGLFRPAFVRGPNATFQLVGADTAVIAAAALAFPQNFSRDYPLQDMWWSGPEQSGWGLNIAKNGQRLFVTIFFYDELGRPTWAVMPSGQWDPVHEVWYGDLFIPRGSTYLNYEFAFFNSGPPIGTASLSFPTPDEGHLDYTINNFSGGKQIFRYVFGPRSQDAAPPFAGLWWGGARQDGWGVAVQQQGDNVFVTWYTYGADGKPLWFFMPAGKRTTGTTFTGTLYRTTGAGWAGQRYSASSTKVTAVGTMEITFRDNQNGTMTAVVDGQRLVLPIERFPF